VRQIDLGSRTVGKVNAFTAIVGIRFAESSLNPTRLSDCAVGLMSLPRGLPRFKFLMELPLDCSHRNQPYKNEDNQFGKSRFHA